MTKYDFLEARRVILVEQCLLHSWCEFVQIMTWQDFHEAMRLIMSDAGTNFNFT